MDDIFTISHECNTVPNEIRDKIRKMHDDSYFKTKVTSMIDTFCSQQIYEYEYGSFESYQDFMEAIDDYVDENLF